MDRNARMLLSAALLVAAVFVVTAYAVSTRPVLEWWLPLVLGIAGIAFAVTPVRMAQPSPVTASADPAAPREYLPAPLSAEVSLTAGASGLPAFEGVSTETPHSSDAGTVENPPAPSAPDTPSPVARAEEAPLEAELEAGNADPEATVHQPADAPVTTTSEAGEATAKPAAGTPSVLEATDAPEQPDTATTDNPKKTAQD